LSIIARLIFSIGEVVGSQSVAWIKPPRTLRGMAALSASKSVQRFDLTGRGRACKFRRYHFNTGGKYWAISSS
jgi:hypothetical protein